MRRERILDAAYRGFVEQGFHAAGMAGIAERAGISAGLIYHYFPGKDAIVRTIIERQLARLEFRLRQLEPASLQAAMLASFDPSEDNEPRFIHPALVMELSAAAFRNDGIGELVLGFDAHLRRALSEWLRTTGPQDDPSNTRFDADIRALMLVMLFDGLSVRQIREPHLDRPLLEAALDRMLPAILNAPDSTESKS